MDIKVCCCSSSVCLCVLLHTVHIIMIQTVLVSLREFSLDLSVEMPHEITDLKCITHKVKIKVI